MKTGGLCTGGIGLAFAASITCCGGSFGPCTGAGGGGASGGGSGGGATTSGTISAGGGGGGGAAASGSGSGSGSPRAALVAGSGDKKCLTEPLSSSGAPEAAPSEGADRLGVICA